MKYLKSFNESNLYPIYFKNCKVDIRNIKEWRRVSDYYGYNLSDNYYIKYEIKYPNDVYIKCDGSGTVGHRFPLLNTLTFKEWFDAVNGISLDKEFTYKIGPIASEKEELYLVEDDIKDIFTDFEDEGFRVFVRFGKRLHQFHDIDSKITNQEIKLGFQVSIWVHLTSTEVDVRKFMRTDRYLDLLNNVQFRLSHESLYIKETDISGNQINLLIYTK
jgi:hypothetical protein